MIKKKKETTPDCKNREEAIRASEEKYKTLFNTMTQGIVFQDKDGKIISANHAAEKMLGLTLDQLRGVKFTDPHWKSIHEDGSDFPGKTHPAMVALRTGKAVENIVMGVYNPIVEEYTWLNINAMPLTRNEESKPYSVYTVLEDITERMQMTKALKLTQFSIDNAPVAVFWINKEGGFTYVNDQASRSLGYSRDELLKLHIWDIDPSFPPERWKTRWDEYVDGELLSRRLETTRTRKNDSTFPIEVVSKQFRFGGTEQHVSFVRDITNRKKRENDLRESEERFRIIFEQAAVGVAQIDTATGKFNMVNKKYLEIIGYDRDELDELTFMKITHPDDLQADLDNMELLIAGKISSYSVEKKYLRKNGSIVWVNLTVSPMWRPGETPLHHIAIVEDITERKISEEKIKKSESKLRKANATKEKFFSIISHDLRNPFNAILGFTELLKSEYDSLSNDERKEYIGEVDNSARKTYELLEKLLMWAAAQRGGIEIIKERHNLRELIEEGISPYLPLAESKLIKTSYNLSTDIYITSDKYSFITILGNIFNNAIKFTPAKGEIKITAKDKIDIIEITVTDSGVGMSGDTINKLFKIEESQSTLGTENEEGTGLGLILCKEFVEKMGGEINVKSKLGKGTSFIISLTNK